MAIDKKTATKIAKEHGLGLQDAAALVALADDDDEAKELAAQFAGETPEDLADQIDRG